jgi:hypothetical protein
VAVDGTIDQNDDIEADDVQNEGQDGDGIELEGKVLAVDQAARTIQVSADDDDQSGDAVTVSVPASFDITQFKVGNEVELKVAKQTDGTFVLQKTDDENDNADNENEGDGNNNDGEHKAAGEENKTGDNGGSDD